MKQGSALRRRDRTVALRRDSHATTHDDPVYEVDGVIHYRVANMPGAVPITFDEGAQRT